MSPPCIHDSCVDADTCCRRDSYKPRPVEEYKNFIRRERSGLVGFIPGMDRAVMSSFYSNLAFSFQFLEYIYGDVFSDKKRYAHPTVRTHYIKTFYAVSFSLIESVLLAQLKKRHISPRVGTVRKDTAEAIIETAEVNRLISGGLSRKLNTLRDKRNKVHLEKILKSIGTNAFSQHDWNAFNLTELDEARDGLYKLILKISGLSEIHPDIQRLFAFLKI